LLNASVEVHQSELQNSVLTSKMGLLANEMLVIYYVFILTCTMIDGA